MAVKDIVVDDGGLDTLSAALKRQIEMSPSNFAKSCGVCHVGGGQLEYDRDMQLYGQAGDGNEGDRYTWRPTRIEGGSVISGSMVEVSTNPGNELYQDNNSEVDCALCHMKTLKVAAAWYKSIGCGSGNPVGPSDNPTCDPGDPRFSYTAGSIYDSYNRNAAVSVGFFKQAASAGIGASINLSTGAISGNPATIPGTSIAGVPNSANCAQCHARNEGDNIGLPGEAQQNGGMIAGYGNFFRITQAGEAFDLDKIDGNGTCVDCTNASKWNEFGCKTGMGKRSQKTGQGSSDRFGPGLCLMCDMLGKWSDPYAFCGIVASQCNEKAGTDIVSDNNPYSLIGGDGRPMQVPDKMPDVDVHDISGQGMQCGTCHYSVTASVAEPLPARTVSAVVGGTQYVYTYPTNTNIQKMDHQTAQGYSMLEHADDQIDGTVSCAGCHTERHHPALVENGGTLVSPTPLHTKFPALHINKIDCRTCHIPAVYSSPGRLLFRDWTAGGYRQTEGSNGNANHFDFAYNFLEGSMAPMAPLKVWVTTPEGTKITPVLPSLLPVWTGSAVKDPSIIGADGVEVMGWAPAKTRDVTAAAALISARNASLGIRLNGTNDHPLFEGFQLTDPLKIESKTKIDLLAAELANSTGAGYATHSKVRDPRMNLFPIFFDPSHGVVRSRWALGGDKSGGCISCHSSSNPASPNYSSRSIGFFDGSKDMMKNGMMQAADYDCETNPMLIQAFDGDHNGFLSCIEPMPGMPACGSSAEFDAYASGYTSMGEPNGEVGQCKKYVADGLMQAFGVQNSTPGAAMDGIEFMQMMATREGTYAAGCNPMLRMFGYADGGSSKVMPPTGTGCQQSDYFSRAEIRQHFQKNLQQSKFNPVVAGKTWVNPITNTSGGVPATMNRVFGIVAVGKNPTNTAHVNKFDLAATCYNPMDGSRFSCPDGGLVATTVSESQLLGYTDHDASSLMNPGTAGVEKPMAFFNATADPATSKVVSFDSTGTSCGNAPCTFAWNFGDGDTGSGEAVSHTYATAGSYQATLTVTDALALKSSVTNTANAVEINTAPFVSGLTSASVAGYAVTFTDDSADAQDAPADIKTTVNWGDGTTSSALTAGTIFSHTFVTSGTYTISHSATDSGGMSATERLKVTVPLKFKVTASTSPALDGVVMILKYNGTSKASCTTTGGSCSFSNVLPGTYAVQAYRSGYLFDGDAGTAGNQNPAAVVVGSDQTVLFTHTP